jgi:carbamoylphosphate synthase small subunit
VSGLTPVSDNCLEVSGATPRHPSAVQPCLALALKLFLRDPPASPSKAWHTFTFPHIGNGGYQRRGHRVTSSTCRGLVLTRGHYSSRQLAVAGLYGPVAEGPQSHRDRRVDTRRLVSRIRDQGASKGCLAFAPDGHYDLAHLQRAAAQWPSLEGMDPTGEVCRAPSGTDG